MDSLNSILSENDILDADLNKDNVQRIVNALSATSPISVNNLIIATGEVRTTIVKLLKRLSKLSDPLVKKEKGLYLLTQELPTKPKPSSSKKSPTVKEPVEKSGHDMQSAVKRIVELLRERGVQTEENISEETNIPLDMCTKVLKYLLDNKALQIKEMDAEWDDDVMYEYSEDLYNTFLVNLKKKKVEIEAKASKQAKTNSKKVAVKDAVNINDSKGKEPKAKTITIDLEDSPEVDINKLAEEICSLIKPEGVKSNHLVSSLKGKYSADDIDDALLLLVSRGEAHVKNPAAKFKVYLKATTEAKPEEKIVTEVKKAKQSDKVDVPVDSGKASVKSDKKVEVSPAKAEPAPILATKVVSAIESYENSNVSVLSKAVARLEGSITDLDRLSEVKELMKEIDAELSKKNNAIGYLTKAIESLCQ